MMAPSFFRLIPLKIQTALMFIGNLLNVKRGGNERIADQEAPLLNAAYDAGVCGENERDHALSVYTGRNLFDKTLFQSGVGEEAHLQEPMVEAVQTVLPPGFYEVEAIRRKRVRKGKTEYMIKWLHWPEKDNTWEPMKNLMLVSDMIDAFEERKQHARKRKQTARRKRQRCSTGKTPTSNGNSKRARRNNERNNQVQEANDNHTILKIMGIEGFEPPLRSTQEASVNFLAMRSDGTAVIVNNEYLRATNPLLLINYYEQNLRRVDL